MIRSHGTKQIMLGRNSGTSEAKELVLVIPARLTIVPLCNLCPSIIYSVPCDRILQRAYYSEKQHSNPLSIILQSRFLQNSSHFDYLLGQILSTCLRNKTNK